MTAFKKNKKKKKTNKKIQTTEKNSFDFISICSIVFENLAHCNKILHLQIKQTKKNKQKRNKNRYNTKMNTKIINNKCNGTGE